MLNSIYLPNLSQTPVALSTTTTKQRLGGALQRASFAPAYKLARGGAADTNRLKTVREAARQAGQSRLLSEGELRVVDMGFVTKSHLIVISEAARKGNFSVSFRDTGTDALEWLDKGAATKPHSILEKTLKSSRVQPDMRQAVKDSGLQSLAAHWEGATPIGVFVTRAAAAQWQQSTMPLVRSDGKGNFYVPIDFANPQDANLAALKSQPNWERTVVTGDYDLHDMISFTGQRHAVSVESSEEKFIRKAINEAVATVQPHRSEAGRHTEHRMVQHGPQANYPAFVSTHEPELRQKLVPAFALPSVLPEEECRAMVTKGDTPPSLAICNRGEWSIVSSQEQLATFYEKQGARIKESWQPGEKSIHFGQIGKHGFGLTRGRT